ncbi:hypothetical protein PPBDW_I21581 [Photobacterium kishitanii]|nr:hypothetical protein PPBDW_I21581 [Photobacterium kishitanii]
MCPRTIWFSLLFGYFYINYLILIWLITLNYGAVSNIINYLTEMWISYFHMRVIMKIEVA